jgi:hypothetical protein
MIREKFNIIRSVYYSNNRKSLMIHMPALMIEKMKLVKDSSINMEFIDDDENVPQVVITKIEVKKK